MRAATTWSRMGTSSTFASMSDRHAVILFSDHLFGSPEICPHWCMVRGLLSLPLIAVHPGILATGRQVCKANGSKHRSRSVAERTGYPAFIENELRYLDCGLLSRGFARLRCSSCGFERLIACSCKGRLCPSCLARRAADTAVYLEDLARLMNPSVRGWINYYGRFYRTECKRILQYLNNRLVTWACRKLKRFRGRRRAATHWLGASSSGIHN